MFLIRIAPNTYNVYARDFITRELFYLGTFSLDADPEVMQGKRDKE